MPPKFSTDRPARAAPAGLLEPGEIATLRTLRARPSDVIPHHPGEAVLMLCRLSCAPAAELRPLRRAVDPVPSFAAAAP